VIDSGLVQLNGQVETRKRKKVVSGDVIEFNQTQMTLVLE
jgi:ribosome-associated protein